MKNIATLTLSKINIKTLLIDSGALAFIYFVPALSHLLALPVYFIEPMRLMLIISIAHTSKRNSYIIAATLPLFSFLISAHPNPVKMLLITGELLLNVWLYYYILQKSGKVFVSMISGIIISKAAYYFVKFALLSALVLSGSLVSTPIFIQVITTLIFSGYLFLVFRKKSELAS